MDEGAKMLTESQHFHVPIMELPEALGYVEVIGDAKSYTQQFLGASHLAHRDMSSLHLLPESGPISNKQVHNELHLKRLAECGIAEAISLLVERPHLVNAGLVVPLIGVVCEDDPRNVVIRMVDGTLILSAEPCLRNHAKHVWQPEPGLTFVGVH